MENGERVGAGSRRTARTVGLIAAGVAIGALVAVVVVQQFQIEELQGDSKPGTAVCKTVEGEASGFSNAVIQKDAKDPYTEDERESNARNLRSLAHVVLQNPNCFSSTMRAQAQTTLDQLDQNAEAAIQDCNRSSRRWWC
ncbi:hypothetical protein ACFXA3_00105 [Streptomyces sp. NPDC059456]|uniref:hypothetical protein n=1 Tax=Streptomyces sp. NPDC059456 TaxID=3346838 RepID=UPI0036B7BFB3